MKTNVVDKGKWARDLEVQVPAERIDREMSSALRRYQKRLEIPGFRRGKVPLKLIQQRYGESIRHGVIEDLLPTLMREAAEQTGLVPASTPRITHFQRDDAGGLRFTASIDIWPEVEVKGEEGLTVTRLIHQVSDDEVAEQLQELRERHASERSVDRSLQQGDVLIADLQRLDDGGLPVIGERYEERYFHIGAAGAPSPQFEESLVGIAAGEERKVRFAYRQDLPNPDLAGKQESFAVTAREVRERVLPELDDEFAKDVGSFDGLDRLKEHVRKQLELRWQLVARQKVRSDLVVGLLEANAVDLPESLVLNYLHSLRQESERRHRDHHGHDHDHRHRSHGEDEEVEYSQEDRDAAARRLRTYLIVEGLRKKLGVAVSEAEFDTYLKGRAEQLGLKFEELKRSPRAADLRRDLEEDKVFAYLEGKARVRDETV